MADLTTTFFGLALKSPVIVASCGLSNSLENIKKMAAHGAGAIVLKSIFEEEIQHELDHEMALRGVTGHESDEYLDYFDYIIKEENLKKYLALIQSAKKAANIPIIASISCISSAEWASFASKIEKSGADALELNLFLIPSDPAKPGSYNEQFYFEAIKKVKSHVSIPVTLKISYYFSNLAQMAVNLSATGVDGITLFNRFYTPDIDIQNEQITRPEPLSSGNEYLMPLRWAAILNGKTKCPLATTTGIHSPETAIKMMLAGANAVQVSSILYKKGIEYIAEMNYGISKWMDEKGYSAIDEFKGKISAFAGKDAKAFERVQFMKQFGEY